MRIQTIFIIGAGSVLIMIGAGAAYAAFINKSLPDPTLFDQRHIAQSTKIYDRTGTIVLYEIHGEQKRTIIPASGIPTLVKQATIAVEDKNFYNHAAVDWKSIARAMLVNISNIKVVQGGSTITQQLAKNAFLQPDRTIARKIKELIIAYRLENKYTKDEILNLYLNQIPYGANNYGIEAAAQTYFNKSAGALTLPEIATLVSLPKAPSYYSPWGAHKEELMARKDRALEQMASQGIITEAEKNNAQKVPLVFAPALTDIKAPHFVMAVQDYLTNAYGDDFVRNGGLKVTTTLDMPMQERAEQAVLEGARRNEELYKGTNAALVAEDTTTGQILALVGSRNYFDAKIDGNFNVATQGLRQPGSAIKPFAYLTAFIRGFTPDTILFDAETEFDTTGDLERSYKPHNFDDQFRGPVTMREGLAQSINIPSVKTLYLAGIAPTLKNLHAMGITTLNERNRYGLSLALGGGETKLIDLVAAYATLSQDGVRHPQSFILKIEDPDGKIIERYHDTKKQVVEARAVRLINDILSDTNARAPLFKNSLNLTTFPNHDVALKTGTTNDYRDAWALGYTPSFIVGVWAGNNDNTPMQRKGGSILAAIPIWSSFMRDTLNDRLPETFPRPEPIITEKPILHNQYVINNEIHSILYYIDKNNPLGAPPEDPQKDAQFKNWEQGVMAWIEEHPSILTGQTGLSTTEPISITINTPHNGDFLTAPITITASVSSVNDLANIELYMNDTLVHQQLIAPQNKKYIYTNIITTPLAIQNKITIKAFDVLHNARTEELIIFNAPPH